MKSSEFFEQQLKFKKMAWVSDPSIGWFMNADPVRLYYGAPTSQLKSIFENGIYANDAGYVVCALDPYTANYHVPLTENEDRRAIVVIDIPSSYTKNRPFYIESKKITDKDLYESWGKSDVEFYALADVEVPLHIPNKYIKGYMVKNDS
jgi:hypothetical protein